MSSCITSSSSRTALNQTTQTCQHDDGEYTVQRTQWTTRSITHYIAPNNDDVRRLNSLQDEEDCSSRAVTLGDCVMSAAVSVCCCCSLSLSVIALWTSSFFLSMLPHHSNSQSDVTVDIALKQKKNRWKYATEAINNHVKLRCMERMLCGYLEVVQFVYSIVCTKNSYWRHVGCGTCCCR